MMKEKETLQQQVHQLLQERQQLVAMVTSKHQEALHVNEEARKAVDALERDQADNSGMQIRYTNLVHDYDQIKLKLTSQNRELEKFKEMLKNLEVSGPGGNTRSRWFVVVRPLAIT